jgi:hypothetical protein
LGKNGSVGDGSVRNGSVATKVAADLPPFNWFSHKNAFFDKNILKSCGGGGGVGKGGGRGRISKPFGLILANLPGSC